jgi:hypothetical protein
MQHLNGDNGMLVMVRWSSELPRLIPLVLESLLEEKPSMSIQDLMKQVLVVQDHPGLTFPGSSDFYPVLVIVKNSPFTSSELGLAKGRIARDGAKVIAMPGMPGIATLDILPSGWQDIFRNCDHAFTCTSNSTTGWKDNTSLQVSTNRTSTNTWSYVTGREINVKPDQQYQFITHMKLNEFATASHIAIEGYNATSKSWYQITQCPAGTNGPSEWKEYKCNITTIPKDTSIIRPVLNAGWSSQQGKQAVTLFDAMYFSNIDPNKTPFGITVTNNLIANPHFAYGYMTLSNLKIPTDDSPFYFAKELLPNQLVLLIETALGVSAVLALLLIYYSKINRLELTSTSHFHIMFIIFIGLGFIFLEITFIQKFLLLLGTPIMALTVILFSILLSSGIGAYMSGRIFRKNPYRAVIISIPLLTGVVLVYYFFLPDVIRFSIVWPIYERIALTFGLLSPAGLLMGFQFPSITRIASFSSRKQSSQGSKGNQDITLLWGVNIIASVIGTVLTAASSMVIGFNTDLLIGFALYLGALGCTLAALKATQKQPLKII